MKRFACLLAALLAQALFFAQMSWAQNAEDIVRESRDMVKADTVSTRSRMVITAKDGSTTERLVDQYTMDTQDGKRTMIIFQKPAGVANTRFLILENPGKTEDRWIFLPSLGKTRRIAATEGSGSFMGTDFSYDDVSWAGRSADSDTHIMLREERLNDQDCWVIESRPKDSGYQYSKTVSWVAKDSKISLKTEFYDKKGQLAKVLEIQKIETVQGRLTPMTTRMTTVAARSFTTVTTEMIKYDDKIPAGVFTARFLETGKI